MPWLTNQSPCRFNKTVYSVALNLLHPCKMQVNIHYDTGKFFVVVLINWYTVFCQNKKLIKSPGSATNTNRSQSLTPRGSKNGQKLTCAKYTKQMYEKHIHQLSLPPARWSHCWTGCEKHQNKEQGKTEHETPCSNNHKATQNTNFTRTAALERSLV